MTQNHDISYCNNKEKTINNNNKISACIIKKSYHLCQKIQNFMFSVHLRKSTNTPTHTHVLLNLR